MRETVTIGPMGVFFTNINRDMGLPGHSHAADVSMVFLSPAREGDAAKQGFPVFHETIEPIVERLGDILSRPIVGTNEAVARTIFAAFERWTHPDIERWGGAWILSRIDLHVRGVRDRIGHAQGVTTYTVERDDADSEAAFSAWRFTR